MGPTRRAIAMLAVASALVACTENGSSTPRKPKSGAPATEAPPPPQLGSLEGRLLMVGGAFPRVELSVSGSVQAVGAAPPFSEAGVVAADGEGRFRLSLAAGTYAVSDRSPMFAATRVPCHAAGLATVVAGTADHADVLCHMRQEEALGRRGGFTSASGWLAGRTRPRVR